MSARSAPYRPGAVSGDDDPGDTESASRRRRRAAQRHQHRHSRGILAIATVVLIVAVAVIVWRVGSSLGHGSGDGHGVQVLPVNQEWKLGPNATAEISFRASDNMTVYGNWSTERSGFAYVLLLNSSSWDAVQNQTLLPDGAALNSSGYVGLAPVAWGIVLPVGETHTFHLVAWNDQKKSTLTVYWVTNVELVSGFPASK